MQRECKESVKVRSGKGSSVVPLANVGEVGLGTLGRIRECQCNMLQPGRCSHTGALVKSSVELLPSVKDFTFPYFFNLFQNLFKVIEVI